MGTACYVVMILCISSLAFADVDSHHYSNGEAVGLWANKVNLCVVLYFLHSKGH
jgi:hypothetical protein